MITQEHLNANSQAMDSWSCKLWKRYGEGQLLKDNELVKDGEFLNEHDHTSQVLGARYTPFTIALASNNLRSEYFHRHFAGVAHILGLEVKPIQSGPCAPISVVKEEMP